MIRAIIVEDEPLAVDRLRSCLAHHEDIELLPAATDGHVALKVLEHLRPELAFLDVCLPGLSGFDVLRQLTHKPSLIFTTAHDQYAFPAFEWGAFDYLLKPFDCARVGLALDRFRQRRGVVEDESEFIERLWTAESVGYLKRFFVKERGIAVPVTADSILAIVAEGDYCRIHTDRASHLAHLPLREFERRLHVDSFKRVHRSVIVQLARIERIEFTGRGAVLSLPGALTVPASRSGLGHLRSLRL